MWSTILTRFAAVLMGFGLAALSAHAETGAAAPHCAAPSPHFAGCTESARLPQAAIGRAARPE